MGIHRLHSDDSAIRIDYRGLPPFPVTSWLLAVFLLLFTGVVAILAIQGLAPKLSDDWYLRFDWWWRIVLYMLIFVGPAALISALVLRWAQFGVDYVKGCRWDSRAKTFTVKRSRMCGLLSSKSDIDTADLKEIEAFVGEECGGPIEFELYFRFTQQSDVSLDMQIEHVDHRSEVLDILFTIARQCGLTHYTITDNQSDSMVVSARLNGKQKIPVVKQSARYDLDETSTPVSSPSPRVAAFDPSEYSEWNIKLDHWQPGRQIRFHRPAVEAWVTLIVGGMCGLIAGVIGAFMGADIEGTWRFGLPVVAACGVAVAAMIVHRLRNLEYEVLIDHASGRVDWRTAYRSHSKQISQVKRVVLQGAERHVKPKNGSSYTLYRCGLFFHFVDRPPLLLTENDGWERSIDGPRRALEPLAAALGQAIDVPWSWRAYRAPALARFTARLVHVLVLLLLIGVMVFFAWAAWTQGKYRAAYDALAEKLEQQGAVVTQAGVDVGDVSIFGDGFMVEFKDPEFNDDDLREVLQAFHELQIPQLLALDVSGTGITDQGVRTMADYSSLYFVNLRGTKITAQSMGILAASNCSCIDVRDTPIQLADAIAFDGVYSLKVLMISDDDVSDSDLRRIDKIPYLDAVLINDEEQTRAALVRLSDSQPGLSDLQIAGEVHFRLD